VPVVPPAGADARSLREALLAMGARLEAPNTGAWQVGGGDGLVGVAHSLADPEAGVKLALLIGGLCARGLTSLRESSAPRHRVERLLRERGVEVARRREPGGDTYVLSVEGGQPVQATEVEIPGDLRLAYPLLAPALARRNSEVIVRRVALRSAARGFLDLLRQIGGEVQAAELGNDVVDLTATCSALKPTRVAGQRAERVAAQAPLLAVLATQIAGEFVIRDVPGWRQDEAGPLGCLFEVLRQMGARVGEYPEGLVIKGGQPLQGARVESRGSADLAMALGAAGMLAHGEMVIAGADCLSATFPDYFAVLRTLGERPKERKR
jgi:3-phosphoshikimate 1-carboxyvinyltransferase